MTKEDVLELVDEDAIFYDGLDSAIIGVADRFGMPTVVAYDKAKAIEAIKETFSLTEADLDEDEIAEGITLDQKKEEMALEWFYYNTIGAWNGDYTPVFITTNLD
jgi:hypothetical protein